MKTFRFILISSTLLLLSFISGDNKSEYILPAYGRTLVSTDFDLDGDIDIASGHNDYWQTQWGGGHF